MTPSEAHNEARNRDAGHDDMQLGILKWARSSAPRTIRLESGKKASFEGAFAEWPIVIRNSIRSFVDVMVIYVWKGEHPHEVERHYMAFEVKPTIYSAGALIRQCESLFHILRELADGLSTSTSERRGIDTSFSVRVVVSDDDPKRQVFGELYDYGYTAWNGTDAVWIDKT